MQNSMHGKKKLKSVHVLGSYLKVTGEKKMEAYTKYLTVTEVEVTNHYLETKENEKLKL